MPNYCFRTTFIATLLFDSILVHSQLLCSIEKAVWKLAQSGPSTEANMYHYRFVYTSTFSLNGRISETKRDILDPLAPKWPQRIGLRFTLSWKWPHPIFTPFFGVFLERNPFFGVFQVGQIGPLRSKTCPWDPFPTCKKKSIREAQLIVSRMVLWPLSEPKFRFLADISETVPLRQKLKKACCSFFEISVMGRSPQISKCHFWAIFGRFWVIFGPF